MLDYVSENLVQALNTNKRQQAEEVAIRAMRSKVEKTAFAALSCFGVCSLLLSIKAEMVLASLEVFISKPPIRLQVSMLSRRFCVYMKSAKEPPIFLPFIT
jgi:hypothetical protein